ncbi:AraC family transcriptional regulator [Pseudomonas sp. ABY48]|uniref:AraC family transcriptional regulator n=1 Tax=Pseudomonas sp. ABY48 TaxID=3402865 RepID=UPI003B43069E
MEFDPKLDLTTPGGHYFLQLLTVLADAIKLDDDPLHHSLVLKQFESVLINALVYGQPNNLRERLDAASKPMAYLRNLRLEQVHLELSRQQQDASVTDIAFKWGFAHLGRFAQEYKKRYGEAPSTTLRFRH